MKKTEFRKLISAIRPSQYTDYRLYLKKVFELLKKKIRPYSYDSFTEQSGLGQNNVMYHIINGSRPLTVKNARKIADSYGLKGEERSYWIRLVDYQHAGKTENRQNAFRNLLKSKARCLGSVWDQKSLEFFNHWYHGVIYELLRFENASDDLKWLGRHLKPPVPESKIRQSLQLLEECQMIRFDESRGRMAPTGAGISTGREIRGIVFKSYHNQMINLALNALGTESAVNRDISSITIGISREAFEDLKKITAEFRQKLLKLEDRKGDKSQVMQVNIQAFPLTSDVKEET